MRSFHSVRALAVVTTLLLASYLALTGRTAGAQSGFYLRDGDRVVFYGDSITARREYTTFVEMYVATRFPHLNVRFVNSGWGGDRVNGGAGGPIELRLRRDVIAYRPTVMTLMLGMNDAGYRTYDSALFNTFAAGYQRILEIVRNAFPNIRITLIQPSPYDDTTRPPEFEGGYNSVLKRYGQFIRTLGERANFNIADMNAPVVAALEKANAADPKLAKEIIPDRVHPGLAGGLLLAEALLEAWNAPAIVTSIEIDAAGRKLVRAANTRVDGLARNGALTWTQIDNALPMPLDFSDPVFGLAVRSSDFVETLDQQLLKVTGLSSARYLLKIDGEQVAGLSKAQLEQGTNLALLPTPMVAQARGVRDLVQKHGMVHFARWQLIEVPLQAERLPSLQRALEALDKLELEAIDRQRAIAQPRPHHYELIQQ